MKGIEVINKIKTMLNDPEEVTDRMIKIARENSDNPEFNWVLEWDRESLRDFVKVYLRKIFN